MNEQVDQKLDIIFSFFSHSNLLLLTHLEQHVEERDAWAVLLIQLEDIHMDLLVHFTPDLFGFNSNWGWCRATDFQVVAIRVSSTYNCGQKKFDFTKGYLTHFLDNQNTSEKVIYQKFYVEAIIELFWVLFKNQ